MTDAHLLPFDLCATLISTQAGRPPGLPRKRRHLLGALYAR